jgi:hypothetical protein
VRQHASQVAAQNMSLRLARHRRSARLLSDKP